MVEVAWGKRVSAKFKSEVIAISNELGCDPSHLMAAMAFETGETFSPSKQNSASKATGLIQFMPNTASSLGTSIAALKAMSAEEQLDYVQKYFAPHIGKVGSLSSLYMAILWPKAVGKPDAYVLFAEPSKPYKLNKGLDANKDGQVTKGEAAAKVQLKLNRGLSAENRG
ncbi:MAG: lytic transglycosylase [Rhizobiales bacterium]|nr:lytic transglycosylase [Hyphomicrobiales bacterium]